MPEKWFEPENRFRLKNCLVPDDITFQTKPEIALDLLKQLKQKDFHSKLLGVDATFGNNTSFIDSIRDDYVYFASSAHKILTYDFTLSVIIGNMV